MTLSETADLVGRPSFCTSDKTQGDLEASHQWLRHCGSSFPMTKGSGSSGNSLLLVKGQEGESRQDVHWEESQTGHEQLQGRPSSRDLGKPQEDEGSKHVAVGRWSEGKAC